MVSLAPFCLSSGGIWSQGTTRGYFSVNLQNIDPTVLVQELFRSKHPGWIFPFSLPNLTSATLDSPTPTRQCIEARKAASAATTTYTVSNNAAGASQRNPCMDHLRDPLSDTFQHTLTFAKVRPTTPTAQPRPPYPPLPLTSPNDRVARSRSQRTAGQTLNTFTKTSYDSSTFAPHMLPITMQAPSHDGLWLYTKMTMNNEYLTFLL